MPNNEILNAIGQIIGVADVLFAETAANANSPNAVNGSVTVNLGYAESGELQSSQAEVWGVTGILSVPALPEKTANNTDAAQCLYYNRSGQNIAFAFRDTRSQAQAGNINPGETCIYSPIGAGRALFKVDGSVTLVTTSDNTAEGDNLTFTLSPTGVYFKAPFGKMTFDATGFHVANSTGARIDLMSAAAPGPLAALVGNSINITTSSFTVNSGSINLGPQTGINLPAVYGVTPVVSPGIPILGAGVGAVVVAACASTHVFIGA